MNKDNYELKMSSRQRISIAMLSMHRIYSNQKEQTNKNLRDWSNAKSQHKNGKETDVFSQAWSIDTKNKILSFRMCKPKLKPILVINRIQLMKFAHCLNSYTLKRRHKNPHPHTHTHKHEQTMRKTISKYSKSNGKI